MDLFINVLYDTVYHSTPVILCVLGGIFAYKANVLNIALEGFLLFGAFTSSLFILMYGNLLVALIFAIIINMIFGLIFSYFSITKKGNFIIVGIAINMLAVSIAAFILKIKKMAIINISSIVDVAGLKIDIPLIKDIPLIGDIFSGHPLVTYLSFALIFFFTIFCSRTK